MTKKTFDEKLHFTGDMPQVVEITDPQTIARYGGTRMLIAPPLDYDAVMKRVPEGRVTTSEHIRAYLARKHGADYTCHLTAGIFINIAARASAERSADPTPYWRTLKKDGELNEKYPEGIDGQKLRLEMEGLTVVQKGKRYFVRDFGQRLCELSD